MQKWMQKWAVREAEARADGSPGAFPDGDRQRNGREGAVRL